MMLELVEANPYTARAYRRAAETIRVAAVPVADLVEGNRVRELRGIGPGIEARLRELLQTGQIAELSELERELSPDLVGLGRYLGLSAKRSVQLARSLGVRTADELREAAAAGRPARRARDRRQDRGPAARGAGARGRAATAAGAASEPRPRARRSGRRRGRRRAGGRRPAVARLVRVARGRDPGGQSRARARSLRPSPPDRRARRARGAARGRGHGRGRADRACRRRAGPIRDRARARHRFAPVRRGARAAPGRSR